MPGPEGSLTLILHPEADGRAESAVVERARSLGLNPAIARGHDWTWVSMAGAQDRIDEEAFSDIPSVERTVLVTAPYRLASREVTGMSRAVGVGHALIGGDAPLTVIGTLVHGINGWPSIESLSQSIVAAGLTLVLAGEIPPGTDPSALNAGRTGTLRRAADRAGVPVCLEVSDAAGIKAAYESGAVLQVGSRNMQNFGLLRELGALDRTVLLRRGYGATIEEFLLAAEYLLANGNGRVVLCESGTKPGGAHSARFEINTIPLLKDLTHLPVIADVARSVSHPKLIPAIAQAAVASGADGFVVEIGDERMRQSGEVPISAERCRELLHDLRPVAAAVGRRVDVHSQRQRPRMAKTISPAPNSVFDQIEKPTDVLRLTDETLASVFESIVGAPPILEVIRQERASAPHPSWLTWLLRPGGDLLVRWTRYRLGQTILSYNLSYVDLTRVDRKIVARLEARKLNLGQLFSQSEIDKFGFEFGSGTEAGEIDLMLREGHGDEVGRHPYLWRRYIAATSGRVGFLVIESLPNTTWTRLLSSEEERARLQREDT
jgi:3-deoxy-7-phosphoheptulonate synthase